jgi:hypothetical protein
VFCFSYISQEDTYGCGLASLAMISGRGYQYVAEWFLSYGRDIVKKKGGTMFDWDMYLVEHGYSVARKFCTLNGIHRPEWPPKPFAPVHLCEVRPTENKFHVVVMDECGNVLDPWRKGIFQLLDYISVESVAGVYKINDLTTTSK